MKVEREQKKYKYKEYVVENLENLALILDQLKVCDIIVMPKIPSIDLIKYFNKHANHLNPVIAQGGKIILFGSF